MDTRQAERGFSLIEGLVASAILLIVAIGIIPLFANSILNNTKGADSTSASNFSKSSEETFTALPFGGQALTLASGSTAKTTNEWWRPGAGQVNDSTQGWQSGVPTTSNVNLWTRVSTVQQYSLNDILTSGKLVTPLDGSTQPNFVQLKLVTINVRSSKQGGILGGGESIALQTIKAF